MRSLKSLLALFGFFVCQTAQRPQQLEESPIQMLLEFSRKAQLKQINVTQAVQGFNQLVVVSQNDSANPIKFNVTNVT